MSRVKAAVLFQANTFIDLANGCSTRQWHQSVQPMWYLGTCEDLWNQKIPRVFGALRSNQSNFEATVCSSEQLHHAEHAHLADANLPKVLQEQSIAPVFASALFVSLKTYAVRGMFVQSWVMCSAYFKPDQSGSKLFKASVFRFQQQGGRGYHYCPLCPLCQPACPAKSAPSEKVVLGGFSGASRQGPRGNAFLAVASNLPVILCNLDTMDLVQGWGCTTLAHFVGVLSFLNLSSCDNLPDWFY